MSEFNLFFYIIELPSLSNLSTIQEIKQLMRGASSYEERKVSLASAPDFITIPMVCGVFS